MKVTRETVGGVCLLRLDGKLEIHTVPVVLDSLDALMAENKTSIVLDMSRVKFISSYGIGVLMTASKNVGERGGRLKLCGLPPEVKVPLEITGLLPQFDIADDCDNAVKDF